MWKSAINRIRFITDDSEYIAKANPTSNYLTTITAPVTVNFSTHGDLGKVTLTFDHLVGYWYCSKNRILRLGREASYQATHIKTIAVHGYAYFEFTGCLYIQNLQHDKFSCFKFCTYPHLLNSKFTTLHIYNIPKTLAQDHEAVLDWIKKFAFKLVS